MRIATAWLGLFVAAGGLAAVIAAEIPPPPPLPSTEPPAAAPRARSAGGKCTDCAVIRSIRQVERERPRREMPTYVGSPQYLESRSYSPPHVGPVFGLSFGPGRSTQTFVGAAGSEEIRQRILQITYEVTVRFDDDRLSLVELQDIGDLRVGDRVHVTQQGLDPVKE